MQTPFQSSIVLVGRILLGLIFILSGFGKIAGFDGTQRLTRVLTADRRYYVHVVRGGVTVNGQALHAGDALKIERETELVIEQGDRAEVLLFDLQ